jgi:hypothetical protein
VPGKVPEQVFPHPACQTSTLYCQTPMQWGLVLDVGVSSLTKLSIHLYTKC